MSRDPVEVIRHRIKAHRAALDLAAHLGHPASLNRSVRDTLLRLAEAEAILDQIGDDDDDPRT